MRGAGEYNVYGLTGNWDISKVWALTVGIDNLFDQAYAESISRAGAAVMGYDQTVRVNEPGRVWWFKAQLTLN